MMRQGQWRPKAKQRRGRKQRFPQGGEAWNPAMEDIFSSELMPYVFEMMEDMDSMFDEFSFNTGEDVEMPAFEGMLTAALPPGGPTSPVPPGVVTPGEAMPTAGAGTVGKLKPDVSRWALRTPWEVQENEDAFLLRVDMPGLSKEEIEVKVVHTNLLTIKGEHSEDKRKGKPFSRSYGVYQVCLPLPDGTHAESIEAEMKDGVLIVTVPKTKEETQENVTQVTVK